MHLRVGVCTCVTLYVKTCTHMHFSIHICPKLTCRRTVSIKAMNCPENMVYDACVSDCQPTCTDTTGSDCSDDDEVCEEGCACVDGFVYDGFKCVRPNECGCTWNDWSYMVSVLWGVSIWHRHRVLWCNAGDAQSFPVPIESLIISRLTTSGGVFSSYLRA